MPASADKRARNELLFRQVNEQIRELEAKGDPASFDVLCECGVSDCTATFTIDEAAYERVRSDGRQFVVLPGHEMLERERVVGRTDRYLVVRKLGDLGEIAARFDPRSGTDN